MSIDNIRKYLSEQYPESFASWILSEGITDIKSLKTELSVEPIRACQQLRGGIVPTPVRTL